MTRYKRKSRRNGKFTVVYDDREQRPWEFLRHRWPMEKKRLTVGDYTIKGYEDVIAIEKKSGFNELFADLTAKERPRFERFLKRLSEYPIRVIVVEAPFVGRVIGGVAKYLQKRSTTCLTAQTIFHWTAKVSIEYNIPILFIDVPSREQMVITLLEQCKAKADSI